MKILLILSNILKKITLSRIISSTVTIILMATLRYLYVGGLISNPLDLSESISWAWFGAMFKLILESALSEIFIKMGGDYSLHDYFKKSTPTIYFADDKSRGASSTPTSSGASGASAGNTTSKKEMEETLLAQGEAKLVSLWGSVKTGSMQELAHFMRLAQQNVPSGYSSLPASMMHEISREYPLSTESDVALKPYKQWYNTKCLAMTQLKIADYLMRLGTNGYDYDLGIRKLQCEHISNQCNKAMQIAYDNVSEEKKKRIKEIYGPKSWEQKS